MTTNFDRWEKDPFFPAAEEVQESADRMESAYRTWLHSVKDPSTIWDTEQLRRDLQTTLGTAKWQLEEFSRAVKSSYNDKSNEDRERHRDFIHAIEDQIAVVDKSLVEASAAEGKSPRPWVRLDERERNELALFLSAGPHMSHGHDSKSSNNIHQNVNELESDSSINFGYSADNGGLPPKGGKTNGHRRTASASAEMEAWKISVAEDDCPLGSNNCRPDPPPRRIPSVLGLLSTMSMESASKLNWPMNGYRKLKVADPLESDLPTLPRGVRACYEKSKSCLNSCDECYDKRFYGWCGATQRLLQRSQYQMQYSRHVQIVLWIALLCMVGLLALCIS